MNINYEINRLISFGLQHCLIEEADVLYAANKIIDISNNNVIVRECTYDDYLEERNNK